MNQATFLRQLRLALILRLPGREVHAITDDYRDFFANRIKEGKTEGEVCQEFGPPQAVARNILHEVGGNGFPMGLLAFIWTAVVLWFIEDVFWRVPSGALPLTCVLLLFWVPLLWLIWKKQLRDTPPLAKRWRPAVLCGISLVMFGAIACIVSWCWFGSYPAKWYLQLAENLNGLALVGKVVGGMITCGILTLTIILLLALLWSWSDSPWYLIPSSHAVGAIMGMGAIRNILHNMNFQSSEVVRLSALMAKPLALYLVIGIGGGALSAWLIKGGSNHGHAV